MEKSYISTKQAISMMVTFMIGSTAVLGIGSKTKQDYWICLIIAVILSIPMFQIYYHLLNLYPGKGLYEIVYEVFGKVIGSVLTFILVFFSFQLGAMVARDFSEFIQIISLDDTPQAIILIFIILTCYFILKSGMEVLGRLSYVFLLFTIFVLCFTVIFLTKNMNVENLKPLFEGDAKSLILYAIPIVSYPFGDAVVFLPVLSEHIRPQDKLKKIFLVSLFLTGAILLIALLRNILVLGIPTLEMLYFPSYSAVSKLNTGEFISRTEILLAANFLMVGVIKICVCLYSATKGVAKLFGIAEYRSILAPSSLFMLALTGYLFVNIMEMTDFVDKTVFYFLLIQLVLPLFILIAAAIKVHSRKKRLGPAQTPCEEKIDRPSPG